jgi:hypothetical protein
MAVGKLSYSRKIDNQSWGLTQALRPFDEGAFDDITFDAEAGVSAKMEI